MTTRLTRLTAALGLILLLSPTLARAERFVVGKDHRPATPPIAPLRGAFPCDQPVEDLILTAGLQLSFAGTTAGDGAVASYACEPGWNESGPEHLYILRPSEDLILDTWLGDNDPDLDLILLSDCDTDACLAMANTQISAELDAGNTYYLVVDGYQSAEADTGAAGPYDLVVETRAIGLPTSICEGGATPLDIAGAGVLSETGNLYEAPNLVSIDDCAAIAVPGGEQWYELAVAAADTDTVGVGWGEHLRATITVTPDVLGLDLALWVYDRCGPDATCLAFIDEENAGGQESLIWENVAPDAETIYLAVDCIRPVVIEGAGGFTISLDTAVPVRTRSFSDVRDLFR